MGLIWLVLAVLLVGGLFGGYLIARILSGGVAWLVLLAWLCAPLVLLAYILIPTEQPMLTSDQASYNFALGFVLYGAILMVPWLPANVIGAIAGRQRRIVNAASRVGMAPVPLPEPVDDGLPRWDKADHPRLSYAELGEKLRKLAIKGGIPLESLPEMNSPDRTDGEYLFLDKFDYVYMRIENGEPAFERGSVVSDRVCYFVLQERARRLVESRFTDEAQVEAEQQAILATIDPRWAAQFAYERAIPDR